MTDKTEMNLKLKCICNSGCGLTKGKVYEGCTLKNAGDDEFCLVLNDKGDAIAYFATRFKIVEEVNLWDHLVEVTELDRNTCKDFIFRVVCGSQSLLEASKELKLPLTDVAGLASGFNEWTGADKNEE